MVSRSEASSIPHLLTGSTSPHHTRIADHGGADVIFEQGTFVAVDDHVHTESDREEDHDIPMPQDRCYELLLRRFYDLRATVRRACREASTSSPESSTASMPPRTERAWLDTLAKDPPSLGLLVRLDEAAIYSGLQCCAHNMDNATAIAASHGCWAWSLLALVPDVGTLSYEKIGRIRELGQSAGVMAARLRNDGDQHRRPQRHCPAPASQTGLGGAGAAAVDAKLSASGDDSEVVADTQGSDLARAQACLLSQLGDRLVHPTFFSPQEVTNERLSPSSGRGTGGVDVNTSVTIDMILTIAAECFGQKDLLVYRGRW